MLQCVLTPLKLQSRFGDQSTQIPSSLAPRTGLHPCKSKKGGNKMHEQLFYFLFGPLARHSRGLSHFSCGLAWDPRGVSQTVSACGTLGTSEDSVI